MPLTEAKLLQPQPFARACKLAFLRPPKVTATSSADDWLAPLSGMAGCLLHDLSWGRVTKALILGSEASGDRGQYNKKGGKSNQSSTFVSHVALYPESFELVEATSAPEFPSIGQQATSESSSVKKQPSLILSINEEILSEGLATISSVDSRTVKKGPRRGSRLNLPATATTISFLEKLESAQSLAKKEHLNLFRYGDPAGDSDDEGDYADRGRDNTGNKGGEKSAGALKLG